MFDNLNVIFRCQFGSHLYGTNTPQSDYDEKGVFLEKLENIILTQGQRSLVYSSSNDVIKNSKNDIDIEFKELRFFLKEAMQGQTYALDILFCNDKCTLFKNEIWNEIIRNREKLLSKNIMPFIGYCRQQASKYGLKGSRLGELERVIEQLKTVSDGTKINEIEIKKSEFVKIVPGTTENYLEVIGKKYPTHSSVKRVLSSLLITYNKYGDRARLAKENNGIDWKAVSHAYRCMFEVRSLLTTGEIVFPLQEAGFLLQVKLGNLPWDKVNNELPRLMAEVENIAKTSKLPNKPDKEFWNNFILNVYGLPAPPANG